jgi:hypothetical protein
MGSSFQAIFIKPSDFNFDTIVKAGMQDAIEHAAATTVSSMSILLKKIPKKSRLQAFDILLPLFTEMFSEVQSAVWGGLIKTAKDNLDEFVAIPWDDDDMEKITGLDYYLDLVNRELKKEGTK